jgi:quinol monooxygenase YgiN
MRSKRILVLGAVLLAPLAAWASRKASVLGDKDRVVRLAELEIDPAQVNAYRAALREEIEASIRLEPGVFTLYAVSVKDHPEQVRLFEMYATPAAYHAHLESAHFKKYKARTEGMIKSLRLVKTEPIVLGAQRR